MICKLHHKVIDRICLNDNCASISSFLCQQCDIELLHSKDQDFNYINHIKTFQQVDQHLQELKKVAEHILSRCQIYLECAYYLFYQFFQNKKKFTLGKAKLIGKLLLRIYKTQEDLNAITLESFISALSTQRKFNLNKLMEQISNHILPYEQDQRKVIKDIVRMKSEEKNLQHDQYALEEEDIEDKILFQTVQYNIHKSQFFYYYQIDKQCMLASVMFYFIYNTDLELLDDMRDLLIDFLSIVDSNGFGELQKVFIIQYLYFKLNLIQNSPENEEIDYRYHCLLYLKVLKNIKQNQKQQQIQLIEYAITLDRYCYFFICVKVNILIMFQQYDDSIQLIEETRNTEQIFENFYFKLALSYVGKNQIQTAIEYLRKSIQFNKYDLKSYILLLKLYQALNLQNMSQLLLEESIDVFPERGELYFEICLFEIQIGNEKAEVECAELELLNCQNSYQSYIQWAIKLRNEHYYQGSQQDCVSVGEKALESYFEHVLTTAFVYLMNENEIMVDTKKQIVKLSILNSNRAYQELFALGYELQFEYRWKTIQLFDIMREVFVLNQLQLEEQIYVTLNSPEDQ